jgi:hypothetical protein
MAHSEFIENRSWGSKQSEIQIPQSEIGSVYSESLIRTPVLLARCNTALKRIASTMT